MLGKFDNWAALAAGLLLGAIMAPTTAVAHGDEGDHVAAFQDHLADYEADVEELASRLDELAERYRREGKAGNVAEFVAAWEEVEYHAAVEAVATPLYPPIWQAISGLRQAVKDGADAETVRARADAVVAALREGLGGLKLKASMRRAGAEEGTGDGDTGPAAAFDRIRDHLDEAVAAYDEGNTEKAKDLVRDAYFNNFEGLEGELIEQDPALVTRLEEAFNAGLLGRINDGAPVGDVRGMVESMKEELAKAETRLKESADSSGEVF
ncbi:hypothetical protein [Thiohalorhabdus sp.]|uniref:hypothetical protein n=1 Tax=Thiohalorhabdus sp. TaxID=3094134 RepID=UPI002FC3378F